MKLACTASVLGLELDLGGEETSLRLDPHFIPGAHFTKQAGLYWHVTCANKFQVKRNWSSVFIVVDGRHPFRV